MLIIYQFLKKKKYGSAYKDYIKPRKTESSEENNHIHIQCKITLKRDSSFG